MQSYFQNSLIDYDLSKTLKMFNFFFFLLIVHSVLNFGTSARKFDINFSINYFCSNEKIFS